MGKIIVSNDFITLTNSAISVRGGVDDPLYPKINLMDYWHLKRRSRGPDAAVNNWLFKFNLGSAQSVVGVFLNDVNFNKVKLQADTDDTWAGGMVEDLERIITRNPITGRYQIYCPFSFDKQYLRIFIPTGANAVGNYTTKWEIGSIVILDSATEFTINMSYDYKESGKQFYIDHSFPGGGIERSELGSLTQWWGEAIFGVRTTTNEAELWAMNRYKMNLPLIFYVNDGNNYRAYLCLRNTEYESTLIANQVVQGNTIRFEELI